MLVSVDTDITGRASADNKTKSFGRAEKARREQSAARVGAMADMAVLRTPTSPLGASPVARAGLSPTNAIYFGGHLRSRNEGEARKQAGWGRFRCRVGCARASVGGDRRDGTKQPNLPPPGELQYFGKLSAGCVAGALLVKYGSLCVPSVTTPNINVALLMITTPCLFSVVVLALASVLGSDENTRKQ